MSDDSAWLDARIAGAPPRLAERARHFAGVAAGDEPGERLAAAGLRALEAAESLGRDRAAALDLLAADALITLALLETAEREPGRLAVTAAELRRQAAEGR